MTEYNTRSQPRPHAERQRGHVPENRDCSTRQADLFSSAAAYCDERVAPDSIYGILHRECFGLFPDEMFADLFGGTGRRPVPPVIVAVVMVLQRIEGCSGREAADRFAFDARWKYAAGGLDFDYPGFVHTSCFAPTQRPRCRPERSRAIGRGWVDLVEWR